MKLNCIFAVGSTGLWPVVSGVAPETRGVGHAKRVGVSINVQPRFATKIRRDAGFHGRDARATTGFA